MSGDTGAFAPLALVALAFAALGRRAAAPVSSTRPSAQPSCAKAAWAVMVTRPAALVAQSSTPSPFVAPQAVKSDPSNSGCCARKEKLASGLQIGRAHV